MKEKVSVFKIRIDSVKEHLIGFELFAGEKVKDTYVNVLASGSYGVKNRLLITPKQFTDFTHRLIAYVWTEIPINDEQLKILWSLRLTIFDHESPKLSKSIFQTRRGNLIKLGLARKKDE